MDTAEEGKLSRQRGNLSAVCLSLILYMGFDRKVCLSLCAYLARALNQIAAIHLANMQLMWPLQANKLSYMIPCQLGL